MYAAMHLNRKKWKPDFNRLRKVLLREGEPDRVPFYELFADTVVVEKFTGRPGTPDAFVEFYLKLGFDYVTLATSGFEYPLNLLRAQDTAANSKGERGYIDTSHGMIETRRDFDAYPWPVIDKSCARDFVEAQNHMPDGMKLIHMVGGVLENVTQLMGFIPFTCALQEDELLVSDMFERTGEDLINLVRTVIENVNLKKMGTFVLGDDMGDGHSTLISPAMLRKYVFPWHKRLGELLHSYDMPFILHSCGKLTAIMDDLINFVKIDAKHSYEDKILPVTEAKKLYGKRIAILGGVDMNFLCTAEPEAIRSYVRRVLDTCAPGGGYALGTGNSVANYIPFENFLTMLDEGIESGRYARTMG